MAVLKDHVVCVLYAETGEAPALHSLPDLRPADSAPCATMQYCATLLSDRLCLASISKQTLSEITLLVLWNMFYAPPAT